jgi:hypothetical protein
MNFELHLNIDQPFNVIELIELLQKNRISGYINSPEFSFYANNMNSDFQQINELSEFEKMVKEFNKAGFETIDATPEKILKNMQNQLNSKHKVRFGNANHAITNFHGILETFNSKLQSQKENMSQIDNIKEDNIEEEFENFIHDKYGYCYYYIYKNKNPIIYNLYTELEYRRKGYAKKHLQFVINEIRKMGYINEIEIEAIPRENSIDYKKLISFYKSMGLKILKNMGLH